MKVRKLKKRLRIRSYTFSAWVKPRDGDWQRLVHSFSRMSPPGLVVLDYGALWDVQYMQKAEGRPWGSTVRIPMEHAMFSGLQLESHSKE